MLFGYVGANRDQIAAVASYTNVCMVAPDSLTESLGPVLADLTGRGFKVVVALQPLVCDPATGKRIRGWATRLNTWKTAQNGAIDARVEALYLPDEPYHNGWTRTQLVAVSDKVKALWPAHKQMMVEAATKVRVLGTASYPIPAAVHYVGFDRYWILEPDTDAEYNLDYNALKSRLGSRQMVVVGESQWHDAYQEAWGNIGLDINLMGPMFDSYREVARRPEVGAFVLYAYQNGFEGPDFIGAEGLPQAVLDRHIAAGTAIKNGG